MLVALLLISKPYLPPIAEALTLWVKVVIFLLAGSFTGFLSGMMGVGGGTIMVPAMVLVAGFTQYTAHGTSLLAMVPIGFAGAYTHWRLGNVSTGILPGLILVFFWVHIWAVLWHTSCLKKGYVLYLQLFCFGQG